MEANKLCIVACNQFVPEIINILNGNDYPDVVVKSVKTRCMVNLKSTENVIHTIDELSQQYSKIVFIGSYCFLNEIEKRHYENLEIIHLEQCFRILLNADTVDYLIKKRYYLISNGWLRDYKGQIEHWGFEPEIAKQFFKESSASLLLLDTGIDSDYEDKLKDVSQYMGIPYEVLPVGLSFCKLFLDSIIFQWREERERTSLNSKIAEVSRKTADYALAYTQLNGLIELVEEKDIIEKVFMLLTIFFAPQRIEYIPIVKGERKEAVTNSMSPLAEQSENAVNFTIELTIRSEKIGLFSLFGIVYPEFINKYKEISQIIAGTATLALANARKFKELKDNEIIINEKNQQLVELNATKDKFFSIIAHDLKSPFTGFLGLSKILCEDIYELSIKDMQELAGSLQTSAQNIYKLLENLLEWSRIQRDMVKFNPDKELISLIVASIISFMKAAAVNKNITIINNIPVDLKVLVDTNMINTVIRNLISNALKFTPKNGSIEIFSNNFDKTAEIGIKDSGIGISAEMQAKLFKPGEKVSRPGTEGESSTGLGLLLCKEYIDKHNGKIRVESEVGKGTTFLFTLQLA